MRGVDISNWDNDVTDQLLADLRSWGAGFVIVRLSIEDGPNGARAQLAQRQIAALSEFTVMGYTWCYPVEDVPETVAAQTLSAFPGLPFYWLDVEQLYATYPTSPQYVDWIARFFAAIGPSQSGVYTGSWYYLPHVTRTQTFAAEPLWNADYDGIEDVTVFSPYAGWTKQAIKQFGQEYFAGLQLDVNVADDAFIAMLQPQPPVPEPAPTPDPAPQPDVPSAMARIERAQAELVAATEDLRV